MIRQSPSLVELVVSTLEKVERAEGLRPDDPVLRQLKRRILRVIADLTTERESKDRRLRTLAQLLPKKSREALAALLVRFP